MTDLCGIRCGRPMLAARGARRTRSGEHLLRSLQVHRFHARHPIGRPIRARVDKHRSRYRRQPPLRACTCSRISNSNATESDSTHLTRLSRSRPGARGPEGPAKRLEVRRTTDRYFDSDTLTPASRQLPDSQRGIVRPEACGERSFASRGPRIHSHLVAFKLAGRSCAQCPRGLESRGMFCLHAPTAVPCACAVCSLWRAKHAVHTDSLCTIALKISGPLLKVSCITHLAVFGSAAPFLLLRRACV